MNLELTATKTTFEECYDLRGQVQRITSQQALHLQPGDVALVRSTNTEQLGDHFILVTGAPVVKTHGLRPQTSTYTTTKNSLLNMYKMEMGVVILKLKEPARQAWLKFHHINLK